MEVFKIELTKVYFNRFDENEKVFFITAGMMYNEISILLKLMLAGTLKKRGNAETAGRKARHYFLLILLSAKFVQTWECIRTQYYSSLSKDYYNLLSANALESLKCLKIFFSKPNWMDVVRNKLSYHVDSDQIKDFISQSPDDEVFEIFLGNTRGNNLFFYASIIPVIQTLRSIGYPADICTVQQHFDDLMVIGNHFTNFLGYWFNALFSKYKLEKIIHPIDEKFPTFAETNLPYFFKYS